MYSIIRIKDRPDLADKAAEWFHTKWGIPYEAYRDSIGASMTAEAVPSWYICLDGEKIAAGMGVIENDHHSRTDLSPNICAVFTDEEYRGKGIAGKMLGFVSDDMHGYGIDTLYLVTDHIGFYERYGWEYICMTDCGNSHFSRIYRREYR